MKNHVKPGKMMTAVAGVGGVTSGQFVVEGAAFGIAATSAVEGQEYEVATGDVWELPKVSAQAWANGAKLYWDAAAKLVTTTASTNLAIGVASGAAANPSAVGNVRLNPSF